MMGTSAHDHPDHAGRTGSTACRTDRQALAAWMGMERLVDRTERLLTAHLRNRQLSAGQLDLLFQIGSEEGLTQQELAERTRHSKANVSQLLDKLERSGFVYREPEGRAYEVYLTDLGRKLLDAVLPERERLILEQCRRLTSEERAELFRLIDKLEPVSE